MRNSVIGYEFLEFAGFEWSGVISLMDFGNPFSSIIRFRSFMAAFDVQDLAILAQIHLLQLSMATRMKRFAPFSEISGPKNSNWISSLTFSGVGSLFFSVFGSHVLRFLPDWKQRRQSDGFFSRSALFPGQKTNSVSSVILWRLAWSPWASPILSGSLGRRSFRPPR